MPIAGSSNAGQPVNADGAAGGVAPELDELLDGEYARQVLHRSAVLGMPALEVLLTDAKMLLFVLIPPEIASAWCFKVKYIAAKRPSRDPEANLFLFPRPSGIND